MIACSLVRFFGSVLDICTDKIYTPARSIFSFSGGLAMSQRPARPAGMPWLSPYLTVKDAGATLAFYQRAFGFQKRGEPMTGPNGQIMHAEMAWHDAVIMFGP